MNINIARVKYLTSLKAVVERAKSAEKQRKEEEKYVRLARITNGVHPDYRNGTAYTNCGL